MPKRYTEPLSHDRFSSKNLFFPELVRPFACSSGRFHISLFLYYSLDKWHISAFSALTIYLNSLRTGDDTRNFLKESVDRDQTAQNMQSDP